MRSPLISLIVPVYNIEKYLPDCLDSIKKQTFSDLEVILVDDGSTDASGKLCDKFGRTIHQKNAGLSAARNAGLKVATGKYVAFVDGDDAVSPDFLEKLVSAAEKTSADIIICDYSEFDKKVSADGRAGNEKAKPPRVVSGSTATKTLLISQENREIMTCNKLYRRELFDDIKFPVGKLHEDSLTTYKLLAKAKKVAYLGEKLYFYRQNRYGSIMDRQTLAARLAVREQAARESIEHLKGTDLENAAKISLLTAKFAFLDNFLAKRLANDNDSETWIKNHRTEYLQNPELTRKLRLYLKHLNLYKSLRRLKN